MFHLEHFDAGSSNGFQELSVLIQALASKAEAIKEEENLSVIDVFTLVGSWIEALINLYSADISAEEIATFLNGHFSLRSYVRVMTKQLRNYAKISRKYLQLIVECSDAMKTFRQSMFFETELEQIIVLRKKLRAQGQALLSFQADLDELETVLQVFDRETIIYNNTVFQNIQEIKKRFSSRGKEFSQ